MKNIILLFTLISLTIACGNSSPKISNMETNKEAKPIEVDASQLATKKDVVCGMSMTNVAITDTVLHNGKIYPFCASACKKAFVENREQYAVN